MAALLGDNFAYVGSDGHCYVGDTGWHNDGSDEAGRHSLYAAALSGDRSDEKLEVPDTPWDPQLAIAMRRSNRRVYEEALMPLLLLDLRRGLPGAVADRAAD